MPKVSILVVTYLKENQKYLDLCLKSIKNLNYGAEFLDVLVLSTGDYEPETHGYRSVHTERHMHFPEGVNYGVSLLDKDSKFILVLNDDVIMSINSLMRMVCAAGDHDCIMGPISNCDNGWKYNLSTIGFHKNGQIHNFTKRFYRYEDIQDISDDMMNSPLHAPPGVWIQKWIAFYCVLFPRKTWEKLGGLDDQFKTGCDDLDASLRCQELKIPVLIEQGSVVWHAGGCSADKVLTPEIRNDNDEYFKKKWGVTPYSFH